MNLMKQLPANIRTKNHLANVIQKYLVFMEEIQSDNKLVEEKDLDGDGALILGFYSQVPPEQKLIFWRNLP